MLLLSAGDSLSDQARARLDQVYAPDDPTGKLKAAWDAKEQVRTLLRTGSLEDAELAKAHLEKPVQASKQTETARLWRTICRWWKEIEVLIVTGATTGKSKPTTPASNTSRGRGAASSIATTTPPLIYSEAPPEQR